MITFWKIIPGAALAHIALFAAAGLSPAHSGLLMLAHLFLFYIPFFNFVLWLSASWRFSMVLTLPVGTILGTFLFWCAAHYHLEYALAAGLVLVSLGILVQRRKAFQEKLCVSDRGAMYLAALSILVFVTTHSPTIGDGVIREDGGILYKTTDGIVHTIITKSCLSTTQPYVPTFGQDKLSYHFFLQYYMATISKVSGIAPEFIYGYWGRFIPIMSVLGAAFLFAETLLGGAGVAALFIIMFFQVHGINIVYYWLLQFAQSTLHEVYYIPQHATRQMTLIARWGGLLQIATIFSAFLIAKSASRNISKLVVLGIILGLSAGFHISVTAHLVAVFFVAAALSFRTDRFRPLFVVAISSGITLALFLYSGVISAGAGTKMYLPTFESLMGQIQLLSWHLKWWGIEIIGLAAIWYFRPQAGSGRVLDALLLSGVFSGLAFMLLYHGDWPTYGGYFGTLASVCIPFLALKVLLELLKGGIFARSVGYVAILVWILQLLGGILNTYELAKTRGSNIVFSKEIVEPLKKLEKVKMDDEKLLISNTMVSSLAITEVKWLFIPAISGKKSLLENTGASDQFNASRREGYDEALNSIRLVFSSDSFGEVVDACRRNNIAYIVEITDGDRLEPAVREHLEEFASSSRLHIYKVP